MINSIKLKNFQCHKSLCVKLLNGVNVFVGTSNVGKSAILRALRLALWNNLSGDGYVTHGKSSMSIEVAIDDHKIIRSRKGKTNEYVVDETVLKAIGMSALEEVTSVHRIDEEISFQGQHDPAFMIAWNPSHLLKTLNSIVGLDSIDNALSLAKSEYQTIKDKVLSTEQDLKSLNEQRNALSSVPKQLESLRKIEDLVLSLHAMDETMDSISRLICLISEVDKEITWLTSNEKKVEELSVLCLEQKRCSEEITRLTTYVTATKTLVEYRAKEAASQGIVDLFENHMKEVVLKNDLKSILQKIVSIQQDIVCINDQEKMQIYEGQKFNGFCPECGKEGFQVG